MAASNTRPAGFWAVLRVFSNDDRNGTLEIQRIDEAALFDNEAAARAHLETKAVSESATFIEALARARNKESAR